MKHRSKVKGMCDAETETSNSDLPTRLAKNNGHGFTLIELLAAVAIIAVLIALLLPVIQRNREEYAANKATQNLTAMLAASNEYLRRTGSYPNNIQSLFQFCDQNPGACNLDPQLATGHAGGYNVIMANTEGDFHIIAEPEVPGITGSLTLTKDQSGTLSIVSTPGSDTARQHAFDDILIAGAQSVVSLLAMDSSGAAIGQIRSYTGSTTVNAGTLNQALTTLDTGRDGAVSIEEISSFLTTDPNGPTYLPLKGFLDALYRDLRWDELDTQSRRDITASMAELDTTQPMLFTYDSLGRLTTLLIPGAANATLVSELLAKLDAASAAEAIGKESKKAKALKQYRQLVKAAKGQVLTQASASILLTICNAL